MKRIVLFVEGEGESVAAPILVNKILNTIPDVWKHVHLDNAPFRVGEINKVLSNDNWRRKILAANKRKNVGGVLVLLDGDVKKIGGQNRCLIEIAKELNEQALNFGAATQFSHWHCVCIPRIRVVAHCQLRLDPWKNLSRRTSNAQRGTSS